MLARLCRSTGRLSLASVPRSVVASRTLCTAATPPAEASSSVAAAAEPEPSRRFDWRLGDPTTGQNEYTPRPSYSRSTRRARLQAALEAAKQGGEFVLPKPEDRPLPGPCGAVMNVLRESGPLTTGELFDAVEARYAGVLRSKRYLKANILQDALVKQVIKVRLDETHRFKDRWSVRRKGQIRMAIGRR
jgi:hypothetical protein